MALPSEFDNLICSILVENKQNEEKNRNFEHRMNNELSSPVHNGSDVNGSVQRSTLQNIEDRKLPLAIIQEKVKQLNSAECMLLYMHLPQYACSDGSVESNYKLERNTFIKNSFVSLVSDSMKGTINIISEEVKNLQEDVDIIERKLFKNAGVTCGKIFDNLNFNKSVQTVIAWCKLNCKVKQPSFIVKSDLHNHYSNDCKSKNTPLMSSLLFGKLVLILFPSVAVTKNSKGILQYKNLCKLENVVQNLTEVNMDSIASELSCKQIFNIYDKIINHVTRKSAKMDNRQESKQNNVTVALNNGTENDSYRSGELDGRTVLVHDPLALLNLSASTAAVNETHKKSNNLKLKNTANQVVNNDEVDGVNNSLDFLSTQKLADIIGCRLENDNNTRVFQKNLNLFKSKFKKHKFKEYKHASVQKISSEYPKMNLPTDLIQQNLYPNVAMNETEIFSWYVKRFSALREKLSKMTSSQIPGKGMHKLHCGCCNVNFEVGEGYVRGLDLLRSKLGKLKIGTGTGTRIYIERDPNEIIEIDDEDTVKESINKIIPQINTAQVKNVVPIITKTETLAVSSPPRNEQITPPTSSTKILPKPPPSISQIIIKPATPVSQVITKPVVPVSQMITKPPITFSQIITKPPVTKPPVTKPSVIKPPITKPPVPKHPITKPPITKPPVIKPPVIKPPVTKPPVTKPSIPISQIIITHVESQKSPEVVTEEVTPELLPQIEDVQVLAPAAQPEIVIESPIESPQIVSKPLTVISQIVAKPVTALSKTAATPVTVYSQILPKPVISSPIFIKPKIVSPQVETKSARKSVSLQLKKNTEPNYTVTMHKKTPIVNKPTTLKASTQANVNATSITGHSTPITSQSKPISDNNELPKMILLKDVFSQERHSNQNLQLSNATTVNKYKGITKPVDNRNKASTSKVISIKKVLEGIQSMSKSNTRVSTNIQQHVSVQSLYDKYNKIVIPKSVMHSDVAPVVVLNSGEVCDWFLEKMSSLKRLVRKYRKKNHKTMCSSFDTSVKTNLSVETSSDSSILSSRRSKARLMNFCEIDSDGESEVVLGRASLNDLLNKPVNSYISRVTLKRARTETLDEHGNKKRRIFREHKTVSNEDILDENFIDITGDIPLRIPDDNILHKCRFCLKAFMGLTQLLYHYKTHLYCKTCKKRFKNVDSIMTHLRNHCVVNTRKGAPCLKLPRIDAVVNIGEAKIARSNNNIVTPATQAHTTLGINKKNNIPPKSMIHAFHLKDLLSAPRNGTFQRMVMSSITPPKLVPTSKPAQTVTVASNSNMIQQPSINTSHAPVFFNPSSIPISSQSLSMPSLQPLPLINTTGGPKSLQISHNPQQSYMTNPIQLQSVIQQPQQNAPPGQLKNAINNNYNKIFLLNNLQGSNFLNGGQVVINNENAYLVTNGNQSFITNPISSSYNVPPNFNVVSAVPSPIMQQLTIQPSGLQDHSYHQQRLPIQDENVDVANTNNSTLQPSANTSDGSSFKLRVRSLQELR